MLGELGLNIQEAHAFSTADGFSLDVFVVDGWSQEVWFPFSAWGQDLSKGIMLLPSDVLTE